MTLKLIGMIILLSFEPTAQAESPFSFEPNFQLNITIKNRDPLAVLGIEREPDATLKERAKKAYKKLSRQYHPDNQRAKSLEVNGEFHELPFDNVSADIFKSINDAWEKIEKGNVKRAASYENSQEAESARESAKTLLRKMLLISELNKLDSGLDIQELLEKTELELQDLLTQLRRDIDRRTRASRQKKAEEQQQKEAKRKEQLERDRAYKARRMPIELERKRILAVGRKIMDSGRIAAKWDSYPKSGFSKRSNERIDARLIPTAFVAMIDATDFGSSELGKANYGEAVLLAAKSFFSIHHLSYDVALKMTNTDALRVTSSFQRLLSHLDQKNLGFDQRYDLSEVRREISSMLHRRIIHSPSPREYGKLLAASMMVTASETPADFIRKEIDAYRAGVSVLGMVFPAIRPLYSLRILEAASDVALREIAGVSLSADFRMEIISQLTTYAENNFDNWEKAAFFTHIHRNLGEIGTPGLEAVKTYIFERAKLHNSVLPPNGFSCTRLLYRAYRQHPGEII